MIILASDTSAGIGSVAVRNSDGEVVLVEMDASRPHSETLLPAVEEVLSLAGLVRRDVQAIAVGTGPGAFTGLRVGLATFKGWACASRLPLLPVPSLDAVAFSSLKEGKEVIVLADARKGEVYACRYGSLDIRGLPVRHGKTELVPVGEVRCWADSSGFGNPLFLGTGVPLLLEAGGGGWTETMADHRGQPLASEILAIGEIMMSLERFVRPSSLKPEYVRSPDARPQGSPGQIRDS